MLGIEARRELSGLLRRCPKCSSHFYGNVAMISDEETGELSDEQVIFIAVQMHTYHGDQHVY